MLENQTTVPGYAIVEILKEDHERKLYKEITLDNGEVTKLSIVLHASGLYDDHFSQGVSLARVISCGDRVDYIKEGDIVVVDYTIDTDTAKIIFNEGGRKWVRANGLNEFYTTSKLISATKFERFENYEYKPGDLKSSSTIFGVIKDDEIIPNYPYVFLKYIDLDGEFEKTETGLIVPSSEGEIVIRQVLFAHPDSPMRPGDNIMVDFSFLYEREVNGELISICMQDDIISKFK